MSNDGSAARGAIRGASLLLAIWEELPATGDGVITPELIKRLEARKSTIDGIWLMHALRYLKASGAVECDGLGIHWKRAER